jgi:polyhydroxyalkanoate synthase
VNLLGHCLGGTIATLFACYDSSKIHTMMLVTSPVDFSPDGKFEYWIKNSSLNFDKLQEAYGNIPWPLLHSTFLSMKPMATYYRIKRLLTTKMTPEQKKSYWATELWSQDSVSLRGKLYRKLIHDLYGKNSIQSGDFELEDGTHLSLGSLAMPILNLQSKEDHIVPHRSPLSEASQVPSCESFTNLEFTGGHVGCLINKKAYQVVWPQIAQWLEGYNHDA